VNRLRCCWFSVCLSVHYILELFLYVSFKIKIVQYREYTELHKHQLCDMSIKQLSVFQIRFVHFVIRYLYLYCSFLTYTELLKLKKSFFFFFLSFSPISGEWGDKRASSAAQRSALLAGTRTAQWRHYRIWDQVLWESESTPPAPELKLLMNICICFRK